MAGVSGQYGQILSGSSAANECTKWTFTRKANVFEYASCSTAGHKKAVAGTKSGSGTLEGIYDPAVPIENNFQEGDSVTLKLYTTALKFYTVPAIIGEIELEVDIEEGDVIRWTAPFTKNGAHTNPS